MRSILIILFFTLVYTTAKSQKWQPGYFYDIKGNKETGFIKQKTSGQGPIKGEGFIEYKQDDKMNPVKLSASDLRSFVVGKDSFVVAAAPRTGAWTKNEIDFVRVALDDYLKIYVSKGGSGGSGVGFSPGFSGGFGSGGFGGGVGGGVGISLGGGGGGGKTTYYFGANTAEMKAITDRNFTDIMSEVMADEPDAVEKIKNNQYSLNNIEKLITYYKQLKAKSL